MLKYSKEFLIYAERDLFKQTLEVEKILGEERALEHFDCRLDYFLIDECEFNKDLYCYFKENQDIIKDCTHKIIKFQDPKRIVKIVKYEVDYKNEEIVLKFPKGCSKQFKREFLTKNGFPLKDVHYKIDSPYDCTGIVHAEYVKFNKDTYCLRRYYDV